ncbi:MAG: SDR family oxidoreductase [Chloroflexota bacterium]|nr:SDR family oxidoreductase [Chloroflexota bacterium]
MSKTLEGQIAVVTGGAGGIGEAYARGLAGAGAAVVIADLNSDGAENAAAKLRSEGFAAMPFTLDVTSPESAQAMVEEVRKRLGGPVDILVNNAALMSEIPKDSLLNVSLDWWDKVMTVNVKGPLVCARAVVPGMKEKGSGKIINQASAAGFLPGPVYRLSKHAVVSLTAGLAVELGPHNINVNAIAPGLIQSEAGFRSAGGLNTPQRTARYSAIPHARPDRPPTDLVGTLLLLASPAGDFINGQTINVDGGWVIRL